MEQMNHQNISNPEVSVKRGRGRPRKYEISTPSSVSVSRRVKKTPSYNDKVKFVDAVGNGLLGQSVSGVLDGAFDGGYLLSVKVGETGTLLRGMVFDPRRCVPVTAANDVVPQVNMVKRSSIPFPLIDPGKVAKFVGIPELNNPRASQGNIDVAAVNHVLSPGSNPMHHISSPAVQSTNEFLKDGMAKSLQLYKEKLMGKSFTGDNSIASNDGSDAKKFEELQNNLKLALPKDGVQVPIVVPNANACHVPPADIHMTDVSEAQDVTNDVNSSEGIAVKMTKVTELSEDKSSIEVNDELAPPKNSGLVAETCLLDDINVAKANVASKTTEVLAAREVPANENPSLQINQIDGGSEMTTDTSIRKPEIAETERQLPILAESSLPREGDEV